MTSTTTVSSRAGVSRGAQLHRHATESALVLAAIEHPSATREEEMRAALAALPEGPTRTHRHAVEALDAHLGRTGRSTGTDRRRT